jgi:glycosyltransferase involved in cell wall biosynthesis
VNSGAAAGDRFPVLWIGHYPAHYVRALHCECERAQPGTMSFLYIRDDSDPAMRAYERGELPAAATIVPTTASVAGFARELRRRRPAVMIIAGYNDRFLGTALMWALFTGTPFWFWSDTNLLDVLRAGRFRTLIRKALLAPLFARASRLLHVGTRNRDYWLWLLGRRAQAKFSHLPYPALLQLHEPERREAPDGGGLRLLYLGRLAPIKAIDNLIRGVALARAKCPGLTLRVIGAGSEEQRLKAMATDLNLGSIVEFPGALASDQVHEAYAEADLFVLPSHIEPWAVVVNEALAAGVPVMCPYWVGAAADLVIDGMTGYVLASNDPHEIAAGILRAWSDRASLPALGRNGRSLSVQGPWNLKSATRQLSSLIASVTQPPRELCSDQPDVDASTLS